MTDAKTRFFVENRESEVWYPTQYGEERICVPLPICCPKRFFGDHH